MYFFYHGHFFTVISGAMFEEIMLQNWRFTNICSSNQSVFTAFYLVDSTFWCVFIVSNRIYILIIIDNKWKRNTACCFGFINKKLVS